MSMPPHLLDAQRPDLLSSGRPMLLLVLLFWPRLLAALLFLGGCCMLLCSSFHTAFPMQNEHIETAKGLKKYIERSTRLNSALKGNKQSSMLTLWWRSNGVHACFWICRAGLLASAWGQQDMIPFEIRVSADHAYCYDPPAWEKSVM